MCSRSAEELLRSWREEVFQDAARIWSEPRPGLKSLLTAGVMDPGLCAAFIFRWTARLERKGHPFLAALLGRLNLSLNGVQISPQAVIGAGLHLPHPSGIVVGNGVRAGEDLTLFQNVTLGARTLGGSDYPVVGRGVIIFANSIVTGEIRLGDGCRVGAGSVVLKEVPAGATVVGIPAMPVSQMGPSAAIGP
jgi:serine O-acetyltransferase